METREMTKRMKNTERKTTRLFVQIRTSLRSSGFNEMPSTENRKNAARINVQTMLGMQIKMQRRKSADSREKSAKVHRKNREKKIEKIAKRFCIQKSKSSNQHGKSTTRRPLRTRRTHSTESKAKKSGSWTKSRTAAEKSARSATSGIGGGKTNSSRSKLASLGEVDREQLTAEGGIQALPLVHRVRLKKVTENAKKHK